MRTLTLLRPGALALATALLCLTAAAQPYEVSGTVTDDDDNVLERVRVTLVDQDGAALGVAFTDASGRYTLVVTGVGAEPDLPVPTRYWVGEVAPNPLPGYDRTVFVPFTTPQNRPATPTVELFDVLGRRVSADAPLAAGLYVYRLRFDGGPVTAGETFVLAGPARLRIETEQLLGDPTAAPRPRAASRTAVPLDLVIEKAGYVTDTRALDLDDGDAATADAALAVAPAPTAAFEVAGTLEAGALVQFDASASTPPEGGALASYAWDFGDGQRGGGGEVAHLFAEAGTYVVTLTVATEFGATAAASREVTVAAPPPPAAMDGVVTGVVTGPDGLPLPDASVRALRTDGATTTDFLGAFTLTDLPVGVPLTIDVRLDGYTGQQLAVTILASDQVPAVAATLVPRGEAVRLAAAELGGIAEGAAGARVELPVDGLVHADGTPATGAVDVQVTPVDVTDPLAVGGFPGPFAGVTPEGPAELIVSYGTSEYVFTQDGADLDLAPGKTAVIEIPVFVGQNLDGTEVALGDELPLWSFDAQTAQWVLEATGTVVASEASPTGFALRGEVTHFSWWNIDIAPDPGRPDPVPVEPPDDPDDPDDTPEPCEDPEGWCAAGGSTGGNVALCAVGMRGLCQDMGFEPPPPPDPGDDPDGNPEPPYGDFDDDGEPWDDDDWDIFCEDNPFCDNFCDEVSGVCTGGTVTATPQAGPNGSPPVGGPRNTSVPPGGTPGGLPVPPGVPITYTTTSNNGTSRGSRTTTTQAGQSRTILIPLVPVGRSGGGLLTCNTAPFGTIDPIGEIDVWTFTGQTGDYVEVSVEAGSGSTLEGTVRVLDPGNAEVASATFGPGQAGPGFVQLPAAGTYRVVVDGTRNEPGAYTLSFGCYEGLQVDQEVTRTLTAGVPGLFAFEGQAGDLVNLAHLGASLNNGVSARIETVGGQFVAQTGQTTLYSETRVFALPFDGVYRIRVAGNVSAPASGDYLLGLSAIDAPTPVTLQALTEITGTVDVLGDRQFYSFPASAQDVRNLVLDHASGSGMVAQAFLRRPGSQPFYQRSVFTSAQTSTATRLSETTPRLLPDAGDWVVEVGTYAVQGGVRTTHTGAYRVRLFAPAPGALSADTEATGTLAARGFDVYRFSGQAGELFNVATLGEGVSVGVVARVYGPGGQLVAQAGQSTLYAETRVFALPSDGAYQVVVDGGTDAAGTYRLGFAAIEDPMPVTLQAVTELNPAISVLGDRQFFRFAATAEDVRNLELSHSGGGLVAQALLRRPGSQPFYQRSIVSSAQTSTTTRLSETQPVVLPADGDHVVEVGTFAVSGGVRTTHTGAYRVRLFAPAPVALSADTEQVVTLQARGFAVFRFSGTSGELFNAATLGEGISGGVSARVVGPGGQFVRQSSQLALYSETQVFALPSDGAYQVILDGATDAAGDVRLGFAEIEAPTPIQPGALVTDDLTILGDRRLYSFDRTVGQTVQITLDHPSGGLVAQAFVRRPDATRPFYQRPTLVAATTTVAARSATSSAGSVLEDGTHVLEVKTYTLSGGNRSNHTGGFRVQL